MSRNLLATYIWIIDTFRRYGTITRSRLDELWVASPHSDGRSMARRTFFNYRTGIADLFGIDIEYNPKTYEYYIDAGDSHMESITNWMLNSAAMSDVLIGIGEVSDRIYLEDIPSARQFLSQVVTALRDYHPVRFTYRPYTRVNATPGVVVEPYFLKIYRQRWYLTGRNVADDKIKTYALDRMEKVSVEDTVFAMPADFDADDLVRDSYGVIFTQAEARDITLRVTPRQAKYFRTLPLHPSQSEEVHDAYSLFHYRMRLTQDLVGEILSLGDSVKVEKPKELRAMVVNALSSALEAYLH